MRKTVIALAGAASLGLASLATPGTAHAGCYGCALGAGIIGGLAAGAIVGSAIAHSAPPPGYYPPPPPPPGYYPPPGAYYPPPPAYAELAPGCHWGHRKVWVEGVGYRWRTVQVCP